jgi:hypothetical protein
MSASALVGKVTNVANRVSILVENLNFILFSTFNLSYYNINKHKYNNSQNGKGNYGIYIVRKEIAKR